MERRAARPLDHKARQKANEGLYSRHAGDPRPNALYDEAGHRKRLSDSDPTQAKLRSEWMDLYVANGGKLEDSKGFSTGSKVGEAVEPCPLCWIRFRVIDDKTEDPLAGVRLFVKHPSGKKTVHTTDSSGLVLIHPAEPAPHGVLGDFSQANFMTVFHGVAMQQEPGGGSEKPPAPEPARDADAKGKSSNGKTGPDGGGGTPRVTDLAVIEKHKVRKGETLRKLAKRIDLGWRELARFNFGTDDPDEVQKHLQHDIGCTRRDGKGGFVFHNDDDPGIIFLPKEFRKEGLAIKQTHRIRVVQRKRKIRLNLQTVDELGTYVPNAKLTLVTMEGREIQIQTNAKGYWSGEDENITGLVTVKLPNGQPAQWYRKEYRGYDLKPDQRDKEDKKREDAHIDPLQACTTLTSVLIPSVNPKTLKRRDQIIRIYSRVPKHRQDAPRAAKKVVGTKAAGTEGAGDTSGGSGAPDGKGKPAHNERYFHNATDNVWLTADWNDQTGPDYKVFLKNLHAWLRDRHPTAIDEDRGYYVVAVQGRRVTVWESPTRKIKELGIAKTMAVSGAMGAYTPHEVDSTTVRQLFYDMENRQEGWRPLLEDKPVGHDLPFSMMLDSAQAQEDFRRLVGSQGSKVLVFYRLPNNLTEYAIAALHGGVGILEDYPDADKPGGREKRNRIHARNVAVVKNVLSVYRGYIQAYVDKVNDKKKVTSIAKLRALGPPRRNYPFPCPAGLSWKSDEWKELLEIMSRESPLTAIKAVYERLCELEGRIVAGSVFLRVHTESELEGGGGANAAGLTGSLKIESNLDIGSIGVQLKTARKMSVGVQSKDLSKLASRVSLAGKNWAGKPVSLAKVPRAPGKLPIKGTPKNIAASVVVEKDLDTGMEKVIVSMEAQKKGQTIVGLEMHSDGERVIKYMGAYAKWNPRTAEGGFGACRSKEIPVKEGKVQLTIKQKFCLGLHYRLLSVDDVAPLFIHGMRSFWDSRQPSELVGLLWRSLQEMERTCLRKLGFKKVVTDEGAQVEFWDIMRSKYIEDFPWACRQSLGKLRRERSGLYILAIRLKFVEETWLSTWVGVSKGYKHPFASTAAGKVGN